jgi:diacylglycerol kinase
MRSRPSIHCLPAGNDLAQAAMPIDLPKMIYFAKMFLERSLAFHNDALHVMVGMGLALVFAALLRRSLADWLPWLLVLALELANEVNDYFFEIWANEVPQQLGEIAKDIALTMVLPTLVLIVARRWPHLLTGQRGRDPVDDSAGEG